MCEPSITWKGWDISRWLPLLHYQLRWAKRYSEPISTPFVAAKYNICIMTNLPVRLAPAAGKICTNPHRLHHMRYIDFILHEVIFFCKKIFKFSLVLMQKENPSFISVSWQMNYKHAREFTAAFILHPTLSFTTSLFLYIFLSFCIYLFLGYP